MNIRESGMPDQKMWESFFDPPTILRKLGLDRDCRTVVDFGSGYGTFALAAARITRGVVHAVELNPEFVAECTRRAQAAGLDTVRCVQRDFVRDGVGLSDDSVDYAMLFNILHAENPVALLREAFRVLAPGGKVAVIHWNYDPTTPRGPSMSIRPQPEASREWVEAAGFALVLPHIDLPPYHYGMVGQKPTSPRDLGSLEKQGKPSPL
jgi:SAM-dependent methyltransferase